MIRKNGPQRWKNIHVTIDQPLEDLIDIDNSNLQGIKLDTFGILNQTSKDINDLIQGAKSSKKQLKAIGSGWALSKIHVTDHYLLNTKLLNKCFEIDDQFFHQDFAEDKRKYIVIAQCGISIAELNIYLELPKVANQVPRSLKTAGIGAGQTIVGAVSGNTHGAAINFGAIPDFVVGIQLCNGTDQPIWIERSTYPVLNQNFVDGIQSKLIRNDDDFNAALISFGTFGVITAFAIETEPIYQITYPTIFQINHTKLSSIFQDSNYYSGLHHLEFIFDPHTQDGYHMIEGTKVKYEDGHPIPTPVWIITSRKGYAPGDWTTKFLLNLPFVSAAYKSKVQYKEYLKRSVLSNVRGTSGQLFTATITYLEGYNETAFAVSIQDAIKTIEIIKQETKNAKLPLVIQARAVGPGNAIFGFTNHLPRSVVFEFGIVYDKNYPIFEEKLISRLVASNIKYTLHWSKNALINPKRMKEMYGESNIQKWKSSRYKLFEHDMDLIRVFDNAPLILAGLESPPIVV
jgi:hypothetical protein